MADETIAGFDFYPVEFDRDARLVHPSQRDALLEAVGRDTRELLVLSHGWNNDMAEARRLYARLLKSIATVDQGRLQGHIAVVGVFWPSKKFADRDLIPGGAASLGDDLPLVSLEQQIIELRDVFGAADVEALVADARSLETSKAARRRFGELVRERLVTEAAADAELATELPDAVATMPGEELFDAVDEGDAVLGVDGGGGEGGAAVLGVGGPGDAGEGGAAGLGDIWRGVRSTASKMLNLTTYLAMKRRAGVVGRDGLNPVLRAALSVRSDLRLHLVGHSFGGRLVTAAVLGSDGTGLVVESLVLLQAAFSHHGFAVAYHEGRDGFFRPVVADHRVRGPIVVTHTANDKPNRWAYPAASRLAGHTGAALPGGAASLYGAMGANGAQITPEAVEQRLLDATASYSLARGGITNLESSEYVPDHGAVHGAEIGNLVVSAMTTTATSTSSAFDPSVLDQTTIAMPLLDRMDRAPTGMRMHVTIDLNLLHPGGLEIARDVVTALLLGSDEVPERRRTLGGPGDEPAPADPGTTRTGSLSAVVVAHLTSIGDGAGPRGLSPVGDRWSLVDPRDWPGIVPSAPDGPDTRRVIDAQKGRLTPQYVHAWLTTTELRTLVELDAMTTTSRAIYKVWPDFEVERLVTRSIRTVKADAARAAFSAAGDGIVWAVADTGIQHDHEHFELHGNLVLDGLDPIAHQDFVASEYDLRGPVDPDGHGTHVAGIIAGETRIQPVPGTDGGPGTGWAPERWLVSAQRDAGGEVTHRRQQLTEPISGIAPRTKLVSLRVLDENGRGRVSNLLAAIGYVQRINDHGRWIRIHGLNLSVGYGFDPEWFACGQSPLCVEVDRLVRSGVSVVVAAGNTGYLRRGGTESNTNAGLDLTINDPGNAELAITVGATHRVAPHVYGVSYFSSKGPTGDGRLKPDVVAPGEKIVSCAAGRGRVEAESRVDGGLVHYRAESGTSMAAPHVSGAIAAFLSIRPEFQGRPEQVKQIFLDSATDLGRERYFQGHGLVDLMRAIQSV